MSTLKIVDESGSFRGSYLNRVFFRGDKCKEIKSISWLWLCIVEVLFSYEIFENMTISFSVISIGPLVGADGKDIDHGKLMHLNKFIPAGFFTNAFRSVLLQVLYYKFYKQYDLLQPEEPICEDGLNEISVTQIRFCVQKKYSHELINFRRSYDLVWLILGLIASVLTYLLSELGVTAVVASLFVELMRRALK